ncbi:hypothetical protein DTO195F2_9270 [Paecilomyces variotii]|nr:hypothetical protein DTO195F2_9270 [Paecilomyces variotii]KAJ9396750.1 hypothetical protein DTO282F9_6275 [Paecilomyces variotii]
MKTKYSVNTRYKKKHEKVRPANVSNGPTAAPGGLLGWKEVVRERYYRNPQGSAKEIRGGFAEHVQPKISDIKRGTRLTPDRLKNLIVGDDLWPREKELLTEVLFAREAVLAWTFEEIGRMRPEVAPPIVIRTIDHEPWQAKSFPVPKALHGIAQGMVKERMNAGILERSQGPYRNPWFLVKKKSGKYRLINAAMEVNRVTIRDANLPPSADEFSEEFSGMLVSTLIDLFSGYDQLELAEESRDLTAFHVPGIGLVRQARLPQGWTNAVQEFMRGVTRALADNIPDICDVFLDDAPIRGPKTDYGGEETLPGIRRFMFEHIQNIDKVLCSLELAGLTIAGEKSQFAVPGIKVVGYVCDAEGRHPESAKVIKILEWPPCQNLREARGFLGVTAYYRIWIKGYATKAEPIYSTLRKGQDFLWGPEQQEAMDTLKVALTTAPALKPIDYREGGIIIVNTDASGSGWGAQLAQEEKESNKRHPARYESGVWTQAERRYDGGKLECRAVLKALRKFRAYLYGIHFRLEVDAKTLVAQLNRTATDLPGSVVARWIAWIQLFDFDVVHVSGKKNLVADGLSRKPATERDLEEAEDDDMEEFLDLQFCAVYYASVQEVESDSIPWLTPTLHWSEKSLLIAEWLQTMTKPDNMDRGQYAKFKKEALKYMVQDGVLFRRARQNQPCRTVVDDEEKRKEILTALHEEHGHRKREATYRKVADRYWWKGLYEYVARWVKTCDECQKADEERTEEALWSTFVPPGRSKLYLDVCKIMPPSKGKTCIAVLRDDFGWVECRALSSPTSGAIAKFLWEDWICRWGVIETLINDGGPENKAAVDVLVQKYKINRIKVSPYNPQANGAVEVTHKSFIRSIRKLAKGTGVNWVDHLPAVIWADRNTVKTSTGLTPFRAVMGYDAVLPIELEVPTWKTLAWDKVRTTEDLLLLRARQIELRDQDTEEARLRVQRRREAGKEVFDNKKRLREERLTEGQLVLLHDTKLETSYSAKLAYRWLGPYRIKEVLRKGSYKLEELDGTPFRDPIHGNRLKGYHLREDRNEIPTASDDMAPEQENQQPSDDDDDADWIPPGSEYAVVVPAPSF